MIKKSMGLSHIREVCSTWFHPIFNFDEFREPTALTEIVSTTIIVFNYMLLLCDEQPQGHLR